MIPKNQRLFGQIMRDKKGEIANPRRVRKVKAHARISMS
jgi:hypothetical protein